MSKRNGEDEDNRSLELISSVSKRRKVWHDGADGEPFSTAPTRMFSHDDYILGWIYALPIEMAAVKAMLDEIHTDLKKHPNDNNTYTLRRIGEHNIVIACLSLGVYGTISAATVASQMLFNFGLVYFWLMVGIRGEVSTERADIRFDDVIISISTPKFEEVMQYDYGKIVRKGRFERISTLNKSSLSLLTAIAKLRTDYKLINNRIPVFLFEILDKYPYMKIKYTNRG
jgi:hypothetical protein